MSENYNVYLNEIINNCHWNNCDHKQRRRVAYDEKSCSYLKI